MKHNCYQEAINLLLYAWSTAHIKDFKTHDKMVEIVSSSWTMEYKNYCIWRNVPILQWKFYLSVLL
jgi:hypothetical protein